MAPRSTSRTSDKFPIREKIAYIETMLAQLSPVARAEGEDLLGYLIDMAFEEAREASRRPPQAGRGRD